MKRFRFAVRRLLLTLALAACAGLAWLLIISALVIQGFSGDAILPAECALVFGAAVHNQRGDLSTTPEAFAGPGILRRVRTASHLYNEGLVERLIMTGGTGQGMSTSEAEVMREVALEEGIDSKDIVLEEQSHSTIENLFYSQPLTADCASVIGVSDAYHLTRIRLIASGMGWELPTYPAQGNPGMSFIVRSVLREAAGITLLLIQQLLT